MNRLATETSLYLKQHANNPVDWYPWGQEAISRAKELRRPIFLSIGYSACHWCHVMEHESFEDPETAAMLNDHFVCIKVDREERPDIDQIYMTTHHLLAREGGGWPLSSFLTPNLTPFYSGTYFPPRDMYGRPSFRRLLAAIIDAWKTRPDELEEIGRQVTAGLQATNALEKSTGEMSPEILKNAANALKRSFDFTHGGFGQAPKFPHPMELKVLLRAAHRFQNPVALQMATLTLEKMARGGIYDQVGGGFHRYSVDAIWLVPHFEKMLYDNALLSSVYIEAFQLTRDPFFRHIACETLDYVLREMTSPSGGFYSTQDADSEGEEGKFYVWSEKELSEVLGEEFAELARRTFGVSESGNFEGHNILYRARSDEVDARSFGCNVEEFRSKLAQVKCKLYGRRAMRIWPGRDEKILAGWNGLMITAFAQAGNALSEQKYVDAAIRAANFVLERMRTQEGRMHRTCAEDQPAKLTGYLEDYAFVIDALITLYEATFDDRWLKEAASLTDAMKQHFRDFENQGFYFTADDHETLIVRTKDQHDGATPSGNSVAALSLLRLAKLLDRPDDRVVAEETLRSYQGLMETNPAAAGQMLIALDFLLGPTQEIAIVGDASHEESVRVLRAIRSRFLPNSVVAFHDSRLGTQPTGPLLRNRNAINGQITAYFCENFVCSAPVVGASSILAELEKFSPASNTAS